jgi:hypothetical protein
MSVVSPSSSRHAAESHHVPVRCWLVVVEREDFFNFLRPLGVWRYEFNLKEKNLISILGASDGRGGRGH